MFQIHTSRMTTLADDASLEDFFLFFFQSSLEEFVMPKDEFSGADIKAIYVQSLDYLKVLRPATAEPS